MTGRARRLLHRLTRAWSRARPSRHKRKPAVRGFEPLDLRRLLSGFASITSSGPITDIQVAPDGAFQVQYQAFHQVGQVYPSTVTPPGGSPEVLPADAGLFLRLSDGTVDGLDLDGRKQAYGQTSTAAVSTNSVGLHNESLTTSPDGLSVQVVADNSTDGNTLGAHLRLTQWVSYTPGNQYFRTDNTIRNTGSSPVTFDAFAAADIYLADSDLGVGYHDTASGAIGGADSTGLYRIFVQPNPAGGLSPTHFEEGYFKDLWTTIGTPGAHFADDVMLPSQSPPFNGDPSYIDNGAGLEWQAITLAPGQAAHLSYFWSFGSIDSVPSPSSSFTPSGQDVQGTVNQPLQAVVATFQARVPDPQPSDFSAVISWGDQSPLTTGAIEPAPGDGFQIVGTHTYASASTYPVSVTIRDNDLSVADVSSSALITTTDTGTGGDNGNGTGNPDGDGDNGGVPESPPSSPVAVAGGLDPASDTGPSAYDGLTRDNRPHFLGLAMPGTIVSVVATPIRGGPPIVLGAATPDTSGHWSITAPSPLPDGSYSVVATDSNGSATATNTFFSPDHPLVIDTVAPRLLGLSVNPRLGRLQLTLLDDRSGLDPISLSNPSNYSLVRRSHRPQTFALTPSVSPSSQTPGARVVTLTSARERIGHGLRYVLSVASGGLQDRAGNPLDGEFSGTFPTGNNIPGGPSLIHIATDGRHVLPLRPVSTPSGPLTHTSSWIRLPRTPRGEWGT